MAKRTYVGVDDKARKVKRGYVGQEQRARKIKKAYIGVGSTARPCWSDGKPYYWGRLTEVSASRSNAVGAAVEDAIAVFAGGAGPSNAVDAYTSRLTHLIPMQLSTVRTLLAGASAGAFALFGGGYTGSGHTAVVDGYDRDLTRTAAPALCAARSMLMGQSFVGKAIFAGGENPPTYYGTLETYDDRLTHTIGTAGRVTHSYGTTVKTEAYALFAGGYTADSVYTNIVEAYDGNMTRTEAPDLGSVKVLPLGTTAGTWGILAGGYRSGAVLVSADAYSNTLTRTEPPALFTPRHRGGGVSLEEYGLICGGGSGTTEMYDRDLVHSAIDPAQNDSCCSVTLGGDTAVLWAGTCVEIYQI